jgi:predicted PurR-regulated permease PerM
VNSSAEKRPPGPGRRRVTLLNAVLMVAVLYFAKDVFLPLVLAILFSFLLAPLTRRVERFGTGRIFSVVTVSFLTSLAIGGVGYLVTQQFLELADELPKYRLNIESKLDAVERAPDTRVAKIRDPCESLARRSSESPKKKVPLRDAENLESETALPVRVVEDASISFGTVFDFAVPFIGPLGTGAIVFVFVVFMLIEREDLKDRCLHLFGNNRLHLTTQALDDAGQRVSRYLLAQLTVNVTYGIPIGIGLFLIGIPNALLWGFLAIVLRFIPYIGPWLAASFPVLLSLAATPGWHAPLLTIGLFIVMELISNNVVEPWLYGASTGLSPVAIIISAVFWTWLWGPAGLLLATPLTVCVAVMGRYIPSLAFLDVLLGDRPPIADSDRFYQRLLISNEEEALDVLERSLEERTLTEAFDDVVLPALVRLDRDAGQGVLDETLESEITQMIRRLVEEIAPQDKARRSGDRLLILPAAHYPDEIAGHMLARLLRDQEYQIEVLSAHLLASEMVSRTVEMKPERVFICVASSRSVLPAIHLARRIRDGLPQEQLFVGIWCEDETGRRRERIKRSNAKICASLADAARALVNSARPRLDEIGPKPHGMASR